MDKIVQRGNQWFFIVYVTMVAGMAFVVGYDSGAFYNPPKYTFASRFGRWDFRQPDKPELLIPTRLRHRDPPLLDWMLSVIL